MSPLATTFALTLGMSFAVLALSMRSAVANKSAERRLTTIRGSLQKKADSKGTGLEKAVRRDYLLRFGVFLDRFAFAQRLRLLLVHANSTGSAGGVVAASVGAGITGALLSLLLLHTLPLVAAGTLAGAAVPYAVLRWKRAGRLKAFDAALPDAIDLMARSLRAGHSMGSSIELIAEQSPEPLRHEFVQVYQQQRVGLPFREALLQLGGRMPSRDLQFLITAILVQKETGGDLTEILDRASHVIRERIRIQGEVRTHTAQGRLTGWILGLLPVIMLGLINIVSPGYSAVLFHDPTGQRLLYAGAILIAIGGLIIRKIVDVQV
jgi:tight adherence protein B